MKRNFAILFGLGTFLYSGLLFADFTEELQDQIRSLKARYTSIQLDETYFHDMGIIAHKADNAELMDLASEIIRSHLFPKMDEYVKTEWDEINRIYETDSIQATERLKKLIEFRNDLQPTEPFLQTGQGQTIASELMQSRGKLLEAMKQECSGETSLEAIKTFRKTGLFVTNTPQEQRDMRTFTEALSCCLSWKQTIHYKNTKKFETDYEAGTMEEEARLKLESSGADWHEAKWAGEWTYRFQGREGMARAISQANMRFVRGADYADLTISSARVDSAGRMNMPIPLAGEYRNVEVSGERTIPQGAFSALLQIPLTGCQENQLESK